MKNLVTITVRLRDLERSIQQSIDDIGPIGCGPVTTETLVSLQRSIMKCREDLSSCLWGNPFAGDYTNEENIEE